MHFKRVATVLQLHLISLTTTGKVLRRSISTETKYFCNLQLSEKKRKQMSKVLVPAHFTHSPLPTPYARPISQPSIAHRIISTEGALRRPLIRYALIKKTRYYLGIFPKRQTPPPPPPFGNPLSKIFF